MNDHLVTSSGPSRIWTLPSRLVPNFTGVRLELAFLELPDAVALGHLFDGGVRELSVRIELHPSSR